MGLPQTLLRLPLFVWAVLVLYWSAAVGGLLYTIKWLRLGGRKRNDVMGWALGMQKMFRYRVKHIGDGTLYRGSCMYLINHRSWADMLIDQYATQGRAMFMSRWMMFFVFPPLMLTMMAMRVILLFKRGSIADKDGFNKWIDRKLAQSPQTALVVYPEGHRNTRAQPLPLKRGMLYYAHSRKMPVQIITGLNKEAILSEKHMSARLGQTVGVAYSGVIDPATFETSESFMAEVQRAWDAQWHQVFGTSTAELEGLPDLRLGEPDYDYPPDVCFWVGLTVPLNILLLLATLLLSLRCGAALLAALPEPLGLALQLGGAAWAGASLLQGLRRVNAVEQEEKRAAAKAAARAAAVAAAAAVRKQE